MLYVYKDNKYQQVDFEGDILFNYYGFSPSSKDIKIDFSWPIKIEKTPRNINIFYHLYDESCINNIVIFDSIYTKDNISLKGKLTISSEESYFNATFEQTGQEMFNSLKEDFKDNMYIYKPAGVPYLGNNSVQQISLLSARDSLNSQMNTLGTAYTLKKNNQEKIISVGPYTIRTIKNFSPIISLKKLLYNYKVIFKDPDADFDIIPSSIKDTKQIPQLLSRYKASGNTKPSSLSELQTLVILNKFSDQIPFQDAYLYTDNNNRAITTSYLVFDFKSYLDSEGNEVPLVSSNNKQGLFKKRAVENGILFNLMLRFSQLGQYATRISQAPYDDHFGFNTTLMHNFTEYVTSSYDNWIKNEDGTHRLTIMISLNGFIYAQDPNSPYEYINIPTTEDGKPLIYKGKNIDKPDDALYYLTPDSNQLFQVYVDTDYNIYQTEPSFLYQTALNEFSIRELFMPEMLRTNIKKNGEVIFEEDDTLYLTSILYLKDAFKNKNVYSLISNIFKEYFLGFKIELIQKYFILSLLTTTNTNNNTLQTINVKQKEFISSSDPGLNSYISLNSVKTLRSEKSDTYGHYIKNSFIGNTDNMSYFKIDNPLNTEENELYKVDLFMPSIIPSTTSSGGLYFPGYNNIILVDYYLNNNDFDSDGAIALSTTNNITYLNLQHNTLNIIMPHIYKNYCKFTFEGMCDSSIINSVVYIERLNVYVYIYSVEKYKNKSTPCIITAYLYSL